MSLRLRAILRDPVFRVLVGYVLLVGAAVGAVAWLLGGGAS